VRAPGRRIHEIDLLRRIAILLIGASAAIAMIGPAYAISCGSALQRAAEDSTALKFCWIPMLLGVPIVAVAAGGIAGLIGRGIVDYGLLLLGIAVGAEVGGALEGTNGSWLMVIFYVIPLTIAYIIVWGVRRVRGPARIHSGWMVLLVLGCAVISVGSGVVAAQLPRHPRDEELPVRVAGTATVQLDGPAETSFTGPVECLVSSELGRVVAFAGDDSESSTPGEAGMLGYFSLGLDGPGELAYVEVDLNGPDPVPSDTNQKVRYQDHVPSSAVVASADFRTGRTTFADVPLMEEYAAGALRPLVPNPALPSTVSGSFEWRCEG
jgi:hypothetical protein